MQIIKFWKRLAVEAIHAGALCLTRPVLTSRPKIAHRRQVYKTKDEQQNTQEHIRVKGAAPVCLSRYAPGENCRRRIETKKGHQITVATKATKEQHIEHLSACHLFSQCNRAMTAGSAAIIVPGPTSMRRGLMRSDSGTCGCKTCEQKMTDIS